MISQLQCENNSFIKVFPCDWSGRGYLMRAPEVEEDTFWDRPLEDESEIRFEEERENAHPGDLPPFRQIDMPVTEAIVPIITKCSNELFAVRFCPSSPIPFVEMKAAYKMQFSLRVDKINQRLYLDCFEPSLKTKNMATGFSLPMRKEYIKGNEVLYGRFDSDSEDEHDSDSEKDKEKDYPVGPKGDPDDCDYLGECLRMKLEALAGAAMECRVFRFAIRLETISGARLFNCGEFGCLVLRIDSKYCSNRTENVSRFAVRRLCSPCQVDNRYYSIADWTPCSAASIATEILFFGSVRELKELCAFIATINTKFASFLASSEAFVISYHQDHGNKISYDSCTIEGLGLTFLLNLTFELSKKIFLYLDEKCLSACVVVSKGLNYLAFLGDVWPQVQYDSWKKKQMMQKVHTALLILGVQRPAAVNPCLKKGMLLGYLKIDPTKGLETVIYKGRCIRCRFAPSPLTCTVKDALVGRVKCNTCDQDNYITRLCEPPDSVAFVRGKKHYHCSECPDFGICANSTEYEHCGACNGHFYVGNLRWKCDHCGSRDGITRKGRLPNLDAPPVAWDGNTREEDVKETAAGQEKQSHIADEITSLRQVFHKEQYCQIFSFFQINEEEGINSARSLYIPHASNENLSANKKKKTKI